MNLKDKEKSLLEIAVEVMANHKKPQTIFSVAKESMQIKGLKTAQGQQLLARFICDFMESGYFVYVGDNLWDLKERQPLSVVNKDASDSYIGADNPDAISGQLNFDDADEDIPQEKQEETPEDEPEVEEDDEIIDYMNALSDDGSRTEVAPEEGVEVGYEEDEGDEAEEEK